MKKFALVLTALVAVSAIIFVSCKHLQEERNPASLDKPDYYKIHQRHLDSKKVIDE